MSGQKAVTAQFVTNGPVAVPGPYSGADVGSITFDVAPGGRTMLNVYVPTTFLSCTPSGTINDQFEMLQVAIKSNGSFRRDDIPAWRALGQHRSSLIPSPGISSRRPGQLRQARPERGERTSCSERDLGVVYIEQADLDGNALSGTSQEEIVARPGPYSGADVGSITFDVAPGGRTMLNVYVPTTFLNCTPSGTINDQFEMLQVAIKSNGSFDAEGPQRGVLSGSNVKFAYTLAGSFEGPTPAGVSTAAGTWREGVVFASGTTSACTSNNEFWSATLSPEPAQKKILAKPGSYSGADVGSISFNVGPGGGSMMSVAVPTTFLNCIPAGTISDHFEILQVTIRSNGSFDAKTSRTGLLSGISVKIHLHPGGVFRGPHPCRSFDHGRNVGEDVVFASGTTSSCTSNNQFWTATKT